MSTGAPCPVLRSFSCNRHHDHARHFSNDYQTRQGGIGYNYSRKEGWNISVRLNGQWASLLNDQTFPQRTSLDKTFFNLLPSASLRYRIDKNHNFRLNYRSNTQLPAVLPYAVPGAVGRIQPAILALECGHWQETLPQRSRRDQPGRQ